MGNRRLSNVILIGMSGAGKSTTGQYLAMTMHKAFIDTDVLIEQNEGKPLRDLLETLGTQGFLEIEDRVVRSLEVTNTVIATGGSIIYCPQAVAHLKKTGLFIYLDVPYEELISRIGDGNNRGIVRRQGESLRKLYNDRKPIYWELADMTINCTHKSVRGTVRAISSRYKKNPSGLFRSPPDTL